MPRPHPGRTPVFHIIPVEKLASVIQHGLVCDGNAQHRFGPQQSTDAAHPPLKESRRCKAVEGAQGGVLADYVPFYFGPRSPMLYSIMRGNTEYGRTGRGQAGMVHLVYRLEVLARDFPGRWCFIDAHPTRAWARFGDTIDEVDERIDFDVMKAQWWSGSDETLATRQAEFLVHDVVPWEYVELVVAMNETVGDEVRECISQSGTSHCPSVYARPPGSYPQSAFKNGYYYRE